MVFFHHTTDITDYPPVSMKKIQNITLILTMQLKIALQLSVKSPSKKSIKFYFVVFSFLYVVNCYN
jgi:hypothetical protein